MTWGNFTASKENANGPGVPECRVPSTECMSQRENCAKRNLVDAAKRLLRTWPLQSLQDHALESRQLFGCGVDPLGIRQKRFLQRWRIGNWRVQRCHANQRAIQFVKCLFKQNR